MAYAPLNPALFTSVYSAALAAMNVSRDPLLPPRVLVADYAGIAAVAGAFAQEFDTQWGALTPTSTLDTQLAALATEAFWETVPPPSLAPRNVQPATYAGTVAALIALVQAAQLYYTAQAIVPTPSLPVIPSIIFKPGVVSATNHVATWAEVETAIALAVGEIIVLIDDSVAPCVVPAIADTDCFGKTIFGTPALIPGAILTIADGGRLRRPAQFEGALVVHAAPSVVHPIEMGVAAGCVFKEGSGLVSDIGATVALLHCNNANFVLAFLTGAFTDNSAVVGIPVILIEPLSTLAWIILQAINVPIDPDTVQGDATTFFNFLHDSSVDSVTQTLFLGTFAEVRTDKASAAQPSFGNTAGRPVTTFTGQMYFDTDLGPPGVGLPIWWNGTFWIDAAGIAV